MLVSIQLLGCLIAVLAVVISSSTETILVVLLGALTTNVTSVVKEVTTTRSALQAKLSVTLIRRKDRAMPDTALLNCHLAVRPHRSNKTVRLKFLISI